MPIILAVVALFFPRILILVLWLFTNWFEPVYNNLILLILGLLFVPVATLWYGVVIHYLGGQWSIVSIVGMVIALAIDFGGFRSSKSLR